MSLKRTTKAMLKGRLSEDVPKKMKHSKSLRKNMANAMRKSKSVFKRSAMQAGQRKMGHGRKHLPGL